MCGGPVPYSGRGRIPSTCSSEHRLEARAEDARDRRSGGADATPAPMTPADADRIRAGLAASASERADAYEGRRAGIASPVDLFTSDGEEGRKPSLGDLGYATVRADRQGRTVWDSDPAQHRRASYASKEAARIREACVRDAVRAVLASARVLGVFDPEDADIAGAREVGNARADAILAALVA